MSRVYAAIFLPLLFGCPPRASHDACGSFTYVHISQGEHRLDVSALGTTVSDTAPSLEATLKRDDAEGEVATMFRLEGDSSEGFVLVTALVIAPAGACLDAYDFSVTYSLSVPPDWSVDAPDTFQDITIEGTFTQDEQGANHVLWNDWDVVVDANLQAPMP